MSLDKNTLADSIDCGHYMDILDTVTAIPIITEALTSLRSFQPGGNQRVYIPDNNTSEDILPVAIACLQLFVQNNWTGPVVTTEEQLVALFHLNKQVYSSLISSVELLVSLLKLFWFTLPPMKYITAVYALLSCFLSRVGNVYLIC